MIRTKYFIHDIKDMFLDSVCSRLFHILFCKSEPPESQYFANYPPLSSVSQNSWHDLVLWKYKENTWTARPGMNILAGILY